MIIVLIINNNNNKRFGGSGSWYYTTLAGLQRVAGSRSWKNLVIAPPHNAGMLAQLSWANASIDTPMGTVQSAWASASTIYTLDTILPPNSKAVVMMPTIFNPADQVVIFEGNTVIWQQSYVPGAVKGIRSGKASADGMSVAFECGSGTYSFRVQQRKPTVSLT